MIVPRVILAILIALSFASMVRCAFASDDTALVTLLVERDGVTPACARASLADQYTMPREQLPRNLRNSCTDDEILALARGLAELSVNVREYSVGTRLHVAVDKDGRVFAIYLVDDETGEFIPGGHILD